MVIASLVIAAVMMSQQPLSLDVRDAELSDFFLLMANFAHLNIVLHPSVSGKITLRVDDVPWDTLLDVVLKNYRLGKETQGNVIRIAPLSVFEAEARQRAALEQARLDAQPLETRVYVLNYSKAADMAPIFAKLLSPRGTVIVDRRQNALIVRDIPR